MNLEKEMEKYVPNYYSDSAIEVAKEYAVAFLDSIREYEHENAESIYHDERTSEELLEIFNTKVTKEN